MNRFHFTLISLLLCIISGAKAQTLETVNFNGKNRTMLVHAPADIPANRPLVISLHGANQDAGYQRDQTKWNDLADKEKFVVVYPNGIDKWWDTGGDSDVKYIEYVMTLMKQRYQIDEARIYLTGFSLGSMMTYICMDKLGDKVAAFAPVSGVRFDNRKPEFKKHVPFIHTHGTGDDVFKWGGDPGHMAGGYPYIPDYVKGCAEIMGLTTETKIAPYPADKSGSKDYLIKYTKAGDPIEVWMLALDGVGHWHSDASGYGGINTTQEIWNFFKKYSLTPDITPEYVENSFDIPTDKPICFTFGSNINYNVTKGYHISNDGVQTELVKTEVTQGTLAFSHPDGLFPEGPCKIKLTDVRTGSARKTFIYNYTLGITDVSDEANPDKNSYAYIYKGGFLRMKERALYVYANTGHVKGYRLSIHKKLGEAIEKYKDFASTSPYEYETATKELEELVVILEPYVDEAAGISDISSSATPQRVEYFTANGTRLASPQPGLTIVKTTYSDHSVVTMKQNAK